MSPEPPLQGDLLPTELWERIVLHLAPRQILKLRWVNRNFRNVIDGSPDVQYLIDLWAAGLEAGDQDTSVPLADRRKLLDRYRSHWDSLQWLEHTSIPLPPYGTRILTGGVLFLELLPDPDDLTADYRFIQLPSVLRGIPLKDWTVRGLPKNPKGTGLLPEEDLLVVCSAEDYENDIYSRVLKIQFLRMSDGQRHPSAMARITDPPAYRRNIIRVGVQITCSRLALTIEVSSGFGARYPAGDQVPVSIDFVVLDWKTGDRYAEIRNLWQFLQFVDEYRIFGTLKDADEDTRWGVILIDTAPVEDPRAPKVIEFDLGDTGPVSCVRVSKGSYSRGARLGAPFQTDLKSHILGMMTNSPLDKLPEPFQVNYGSICSVASEDETASFVPWDLWKHKTTGVGHHADRALVGEYVGPRRLEIVASPGPEVILRSFDFTPGAWRYTKKSDASPQDKAEYPVRRAKLADRHPRGRNVTWEFSEDNVLAFVENDSREEPSVLELWTF